MIGPCPCLTCSGFCGCRIPNHHENPMPDNQPMSDTKEELLSEEELSNKLSELLLHDKNCFTPAPTGCSCGALLVRLNIKNLIQSQKKLYADMVIGLDDNSETRPYQGNMQRNHLRAEQRARNK